MNSSNAPSKLNTSFCLLILMFCFLLSACGSNKKNDQKNLDDVEQSDSESTNDTSEIASPPPPMPAIAPGSISAEFEITSFTKNSETLKLQVKIIEIMEYGSATEPIAVGEKLELILPTNVAETSFNNGDIIKVVFEQNTGKSTFGNSSGSKTHKIIKLIED